jgi:hypothetical protein
MAHPSLKVGIVGLGSMGKRYLSYLLEKGGDEIYVCDKKLSSEQWLADNEINKSVTRYPSFYELLDLKLQLLIIATPAKTHMQFLQDLRSHHPRCSVLVEKPLSDVSLSHEELRWCLDQSTNGLISVGYNWRLHDFAKHLHKIRYFVKDLTLFVSSDMRQWPGDDYCDPLREFSHELDLVRYFTHDTRFNSIRMTTQGRFVIDGIHHQGNWRVRVDPYREPSRRWIRVTMMDGSIIKYAWDKREDVIEGMYREQLRELYEATINSDTSESLTCNLSDAIYTTLMIDDISDELERVECESAGVVM